MVITKEYIVIIPFNITHIFVALELYIKLNSYVIIGNVDPKPTNLSGSDGVGGAPNCGTVGKFCEVDEKLLLNELLNG